LVLNCTEWCWEHSGMTIMRVCSLSLTSSETRWRCSVFISLQRFCTYDVINTYRGSGSVVPFILNLSTRWRSVDSFTFRPLYARETAPSALWREGGGPRAGLDTSTSENSLASVRTPTSRPVAYSIDRAPSYRPMSAKTWKIFCD